MIRRTVWSDPYKAGRDGSQHLAKHGNALTANAGHK